MKYALWIIQGLLAALFLFAGVMKFVVPVAEMTKEIQMPGLLLHFIGVCEILGGLGLVLPALLKIRPGLTSLAALGLLIIILGAIVITATSNDPAQAVVPVIVALALAFVIYGRRRLRPTAVENG